MTILEAIGLAVVVLTSAFGAALILVFAFKGVKAFVHALFDEHDAEQIRKMSER